jgi:WhiB family transcriptional regulator, redox-sensing transcriptional regulator
VRIQWPTLWISCTSAKGRHRAFTWQPRSVYVDAWHGVLALEKILDSGHLVVQSFNSMYDTLTDEPIPTGAFRHSVLECFHLLDRPDWHADALCQEHPQLSWFEGADTSVAQAVCRRCLVQDECLRYALENDPLAGVWGGLTSTERRHLRRSEGAEAAAAVA